jgi:phosphoribosylanthranilate isomerase
VTRVKICGLRDAETAVEAAKAGTDFIGLMFAESRRKVTPQECYDIVEALHELRRVPGPVTLAGPGRDEVSARSWFGAWNEAIEETLFRCRPLIVGVFADQDIAEVNDIAEAAKLDIVQLSGGEDDSYIAPIRRPVLKVIHIHEQTTVEDVFDAATPGFARAILLDTASATIRGGTGQTFDWSIAEEAETRFPAMLAGGLTPENVAEAVTRARPWAVDVSSGVETDGVKDIDKVRAFIKAAKGVQVGR